MRKNIFTMALAATMAVLTHDADAANQYIRDNDDTGISDDSSHDHDIHRTVNLDDVVVSANKSVVKRKDAPVVVNVISAKLLEQVNAPDLAKTLSYQSGLRVENNCQNCGFPQVRINGLEGPYSQILINSRPVVSSLAGVYGLEQIPAAMVDRIEVVRGGGSALLWEER